MQGIQFKFYGITNNLIGVLYANDSPNAELTQYRTVWQPQSGEVSDTWVLSNLLPTAYTAKWYESTDGVTLETEIDTWAFDGSMLQDTIIERYEYVVDRGEDNVSAGTGSLVWADPVSGENVLNDERLKGAEYETMDVIYDQNNVKTSDQFTILPNGGIQLTGTDVWDADVKVIIRYFKKGLIKQLSVDAADYNIHEVPANGDFDNTYYSKDNVAAFTQSIGLTAFPKFSLIPTGTKARFSTYTGAQRYWGLQFAAGDTVRYKGKDRNAIWLAPDEYIELKWANGKCYIVNEHTRYEKAGEIAFASRELPGSEYALGGEVATAEYPRIFSELETYVSYADYDKYTDLTMPDGVTIKRYYYNRGKYAVSADATMMKLPDPRGFTFTILKNYDATEDTNRLSQGPGGMMAQQILKHNHAYSRSQTDIPPDGAKGKAQIEPNRMKGGNDRGVWVQDKNVSDVGGEVNAMDNIGMYGIVWL